MRATLTMIVLLLTAGCGNVAPNNAASPVAFNPGETAGAAPMPQDTAEPITAEEMAAMNLADAEEAYMHLTHALQQQGRDEATKERLWSEWRLIRGRVRELKKSDGS